MGRAPPLCRQDGLASRSVASLPSPRNGDEEAGRRPIREPGVAARVEPQPHDRGGNDLRSRGSLYLAEGGSAGVAAKEPRATDRVERQLQYGACEQGCASKLAVADGEQLTCIRPGPKRRQ